MLSNSQKLLFQIAFNLLLILLVLIAFVSVLREMLSPQGDLGENLFLLAVLGVLLFIGIGFMIKLLRENRRRE